MTKEEKRLDVTSYGSQCIKKENSRSSMTDE